MTDIIRIILLSVITPLIIWSMIELYRCDDDWEWEEEFEQEEEPKEEKRIYFLGLPLIEEED